MVGIHWLCSRDNSNSSDLDVDNRRRKGIAETGSLRAGLCRMIPYILMRQIK